MTDVLLVSLGSTAGLRAADDELEAGLVRAGAGVRRVAAAAPREVRTFMATDLAWARAARKAAMDALAEEEARAVLYSTTTAALLWPRPGAIRFDALAADTRPGRHGLWQRPLEARRLRAAPLLVPMTPLPGLPGFPVVVPIPVEPSGPPGVRDIAALTYGANWRKKGLDRVLAAWARLEPGTLCGSTPPDAVKAHNPQVADREPGVLRGVPPLPPPAEPGPELVVAGVAAEQVEEAWRAGGGTGRLPASVRVVGRLGPQAYRALLRRARVFVTAPRREDYGIAQLEALADGCTLVTTTAPGPYAALSIARARDARLVVEDPENPAALAAALAHALSRARMSVHPSGADPHVPQDDLAAYTRASVDRVIADELLPRLLG